MVPIGHPGGGHNIHGGPHSVPTMPNTPTGPNSLTTNQSNKASSSVVSAYHMHSAHISAFQITPNVKILIFFRFRNQTTP